MAPDFPEGVALVAGGGGGIGAAVCRALAARGADVAITWRSGRAAAEAAAEAVRAAGRRAETRQVDLTDPAAVDAFAGEMQGAFGRIHSAVYAAGPRLVFDYAAALPPETFRETLSADVAGCFNLVSACVKRMKREGGALVAVTTTATGDKVPSQDILSAAPKAAIETLMRGIAKEEGRFGIRANCVGPGFVEAGMGAQMFAEVGESVVEGLRRSLPLRRFGAPEDIAEAVAFLLSARAGYITGQSLAVDGGWRL